MKYFKITMVSGAEHLTKTLNDSLLYNAGGFIQLGNIRLLVKNIEAIEQLDPEQDETLESNTDIVELI